MENIRKQNKKKNWPLGGVIFNFKLVSTFHLRIDVLIENFNCDLVSAIVMSIY